MMAHIHAHNVSNPLLLPEIVGLVVDRVHMVPDLLRCACVNRTWSMAALKKLYKGSLNDMQFRTPDIGSLNCLFVASRERFGRNMAFVKHLLLSPENPSIDEVAHPYLRLQCAEQCRAMRQYKSAELLLRPHGGGLASLTIPFEIEGQNLSHISDLLLPRTVEFLAIDDFYIKLLMASSHYAQELVNHENRFSNLKALTIYRSDNSRDIDQLCQLLRSCDLQFFHFEEPSGSDILTESETVQLLSYLRRQANLKALALLVPHCVPLLESVSTTLANEEQVVPWTGLKMLHLGIADQHWLEQLPKFEKLEMLTLQQFTPETSIEQIIRCRNLRAIKIVCHEPFNVEVLLDIARGSPLLQRFSVSYRGSRREPELAEDLCLGLFHALPRLEYFGLNLRFRIDGARLQDIARRCPRLTILALPGARLCLSMALLEKTSHPFRQLESMQFAKIFFENPRHLIEQQSLQAIAREWRRVFPKLRGMPCPADIYYMQPDGASEEPEGYRAGVDEEMPDLSEQSSGDSISVSSDEDMSLSEPGLDFDDYGSDWLILRTKLWKIFGYEKDLDVLDKAKHMWQKNLEIEIIDWPVVPLQAFIDPNNHSTTARPSS